MAQIAATVRDHEPAKCYFIANPEHGCWGIFTVCQPLALLQVSSNFGTYMARWEGREDEFIRLFTERNPGYTMGYFGSSAEASGAFSALYQNDRLGHNLNGIRDYLWPLFIEKLKAEMEVSTS